MGNKSTINIGKLLRENTKCRVSPEAVNELIARIRDGISEIGPELDKLALNNKRKTIQEEDIIRYYDYHNGWL